MKVVTTKKGLASVLGTCNLCRVKLGKDSKPIPLDPDALVIHISIQLTPQAGYEFRLCPEHAVSHSGEFMVLGEEIADFGADGE